MEIGAYKMNRKKYLKKAYDIKLEIISKKEVLKERRATLVEEERELEALYDSMEKLSHMIDEVEDVMERALLRYRYITCLTWEQIAEKMGFCLAQVHRIHSRALKNFDKINEMK